MHKYFLFTSTLFLFLLNGCFSTSYLSDTDKSQPRSQLCGLVLNPGCNKANRFVSMDGKSFEKIEILYAPPGRHEIEYTDLKLNQYEYTERSGTKVTATVSTEVVTLKTHVFLEKGHIYIWECEKRYFVDTGKKIPEKE